MHAFIQPPGSGELLLPERYLRKESGTTCSRRMSLTGCSHTPRNSCGPPAGESKAFLRGAVPPTVAPHPDFGACILSPPSKTQLLHGGRSQKSRPPELRSRPGEGTGAAGQHYSSGRGSATRRGRGRTSPRTPESTCRHSLPNPEPKPLRIRTSGRK